MSCSPVNAAQELGDEPRRLNAARSVIGGASEPIMTKVGRGKFFDRARLLSSDLEQLVFSAASVPLW